jgi:hypothetical protein
VFSSVNGFINCTVKYFVKKSVNFNTLNSANLFLEFLMVRDDLLQISDNVISSDDLQCLIEFICTSLILSLTKSYHLCRIRNVLFIVCTIYIRNK